MSQIPRDTWLDATLSLMMDGYAYISKRCRRYQTDLFETRLMFQKTVCMMGEEAAQIFYDSHRFQRQGALPQRAIKTLLGKGSVMTLDGEAHRERKQMFMSLMSSERIQRLVQITAEQWRAASHRWEARDTIVLFDEASEILCRAACQWEGVPLREDEARMRTNDFMAMVDSPAALGPRYWRGRRARKRAEAWIAQIIEAIRDRRLDVPEGGAAYVIAWHRNADGNLLDSKTAAVELINMLRPIVAIGRYVVFAAHALHENPQCRLPIAAGDEEYLASFVHEVRRFYPFFPFVGAIVKNEFDWKGYHFPKGRRVLLDLYGTNHDARLWRNPDEFQPERFRHWDGSAFDFMPQGGGNHHQNHRCAGEWITIELTKVAVRMLTQSMEYQLPHQDLKISLRRIPAIPKSRFVIGNVSVASAPNKLTDDKRRVLEPS